MQIRNRIKELRTVSPDEVAPNPRNWRTHPKEQRDALRGVLSQVGIAAPVIAYHSARHNGLVLIDGHERMTVGVPFPAVILDVDDAEADVLLATFDPLTNMAGTDTALLDDLLRDISTDSPAVSAMLDALATEAGIVPNSDDWGAALGGLATGDRAPFQQMTFTLSDAQTELVKRALAAAKDAGDFVDTGNENSNGNALARIAEAYLD